MWEMLLLYTKHSLLTIHVYTIQQTSEYQHVMQACRCPTFHNTTTERSNSEICVDRYRSTTPHTVQSAALIIRCNEHALLIKSFKKSHRCQLLCVESTPQLSTCHSDFLLQAVHWSRRAQNQVKCCQLRARPRGVHRRPLLCGVWNERDTLVLYALFIVTCMWG